MHKYKYSYKYQVTNNRQHQRALLKDAKMQKKKPCKNYTNYTNSNCIQRHRL